MQSKQYLNKDVELYKDPPFINFYIEVMNIIIIDHKNIFFINKHNNSKVFWVVSKAQKKNPKSEVAKR